MEDMKMREVEKRMGYDPTDDEFEEDEAGVKSDEEIFTDEYMLAFAEEADREVRRRMVLDRIVTLMMILILIGCATLIASIFI